jgi:hypothetical protein
LLGFKQGYKDVKVIKICSMLQLMVSFTLSMVLATSQAGSPAWTFTPLTPTTLTLSFGEIGLVQYQVTNQSHRVHQLMMPPIPGMTASGTCSLPLGYQQTCLLILTIDSQRLTYPIADGPVLCQQGNLLECYRPSPAHRLHITQAPPLTEATITVTGSPLVLTANGVSGSFIIRNLSTQVTATNITANLTATALSGQVTEIGNTCERVPPGGDCLLTYLAGNQVVAPTALTIQGTNTNIVTAVIAVQSDSTPTEATITVTGSPLVLTVNGMSGSLTITNLSTQVTTTNITTNLTDTALNGRVTETDNNCDHIPPGGHCLLTYTPGNQVVAPTTVTIQGTNTNLVTASIAVQSGSTLSTINPMSGTASGETGFTLTGTGLTGATGITFDGVAATSVQVVNSTTVTGVTPAHPPGAVNVVIETPAGGAQLTQEQGYTYSQTVVGQASGGGTIACLNGELNNLIAATNDNGTIAWGGSGTAIGLGARSTTNGATNTTAIVAKLGTNSGTPYAAQLCDNFEVDSQGHTPCQVGNTCYNDWFLPAGNNTSLSGQLNCLYINRLAIGGFSNLYYWSSTEFDATTAWGQYFNLNFSGNQTSNFKFTSTSISARCVRAFTPLL